MRLQDTEGQREIDQVLKHLGKTKTASVRNSCSTANKSPTFQSHFVWLCSVVFTVFLI